MRPSSTASLWHPANALAGLGLLILRLLTCLPLPVTQWIGKALGSVAAVVFPYRRQVGLANLRLCFPDLSEQERKHLLYRHYQAMGMGLFEMGAAWWKPSGPIKRISSVKGLEHLEAVRRSGRGALLLSAHFTTLEIGGRCLNEAFQFSCLYRKPNQPYIAKVMTAVREDRMREVIHFNDIKRMLRALRAGEFIWYAPDQGRRVKESALLPFFGEPAVTNTATGRIARMGKAAVLPFFVYRLPDGRYEAEVLPELAGIPSDDPEADARAITALIEEAIRRVPEQYFWLHKRFKRRGPGLPDVYAPRAGK